jgi:glycolate oxidase FAD binding subunit
MKDVFDQLCSILPSSGVYTGETIHNLNFDFKYKNILKAVKNQTTANFIVFPHNQEQLSQILQLAQANSWNVLPCGNATKVHWSGLINNVSIIVSTLHLNRVIEQAVGDLTVTVEAGIKFKALQELLAKNQQFIALDPAYIDHATMGGIVATADTGSFRQRYGGVRDMLLGISFVRADGNIAKAGGRVVKNVAGYDLMKLYTGSYGTLGILSQLTFRVYPLADSSQTVVLQGESAAIAQIRNQILTAAFTPTAFDVISAPLSAHLGLGHHISLIVRFQSLPESVQVQSNSVLKIGENLGLKGTIYTQANEQELWQKLQYENWAIATDDPITCKIGLSPNESLQLLDKFPEIMTLIHVGKGLGIISIKQPEYINTIREYCQEKNGFLSILEATRNIKEKIDILGYNGNSLKLMKKIKHQFDPHNILSPNRLF